ncbi:MAG: hypothetical protein EXR72_00300 [Myxococcales bacterium]|nr:hypothetical protein [Myxococcales bacterium]
MSAPFRRLELGALRIDDERPLRHIALYPRLKALLIRDQYTFRVPGPATSSDWNRALFLNLGFFRPGDAADVLVDERIPADVVAHVAWHHLAGRALGPAGKTADGLLLAESIASAFDLHLVGRLLPHAPRSTFLATQVTAMAEVASSAGLGAADFAALLAAVAGDPEQAFADLRRLLFTALTRLLRAPGTDAAARILAGLAGHRFHALLHHYNLANWILFARAHAVVSPRVDPRIATIDRALARAPVALGWLERSWLRPVEGG